MRLWLDCETASHIDISHGVDAYWEAADARILIVTFALDDGPVGIWDRSDPLTPAPTDLIRGLNEADTISAHNARFERIAFKRTGLCQAPIERWHCTMAQAYSHGLPGALDALAKFLGVPEEQQKLAEGKALIRLFCTPPYANPAEHPDEWARFCDYAKQDVVTMRECHKRMPAANYPNNPVELAAWRLDQRINDFGFEADTNLAHSMIAAVDRETEELNRTIAELTDGHITKGTQNARIQDYLRYVHGVDLPNMQKATLAEYNPTSADVSTILNVRRDANRASTAKWRRVVESSVGGRLRGTSQFCGADRTGRWAGRIFNPLNLPRPDEAPDAVELDIQEALAGRPPLFHRSEHDRAANSLRGAIIAPPGKALAVADWSAIEGTLLGYIADEQWVLDAYAEGRDMYIETYCSTFAVERFGKKDRRRQHGKVVDLASGYEGGAGAYLTFCKTYGVDPEELAKPAWQTADEEIRDGAEWMWDEWAVPRNQTFDLSRQVYLGLQCAKLMWRRARPKTTQLWKDLKNASFDALEHRGQAFEAGKCKFLATDTILALRLPTGRLLMYWNPRVRMEQAVNDDGEPLGKAQRALSYLTGRGYRTGLYGGKTAENICQALGREILVRAMLRMQNTPYRDIVLHVYDEVAAEVDEALMETDPKATELCRLICEPVDELPGLPLAAEGYITPPGGRYRKAD